MYSQTFKTQRSKSLSSSSSSSPSYSSIQSSPSMSPSLEIISDSASVKRYDTIFDFFEDWQYSIYMIIGNDATNQYRSTRQVEECVLEIIKQIPYRSPVLYFGGVPNPQKPDIGLVFQKLHEFRPDIVIHMIQPSTEQGMEIPSFVSSVSIDEETDKRGFELLEIERGAAYAYVPTSNIKQWAQMQNYAKKVFPEDKDIGIQKIFCLGGNELVLQEMVFAAVAFGIDIQYCPLERKYKNDGETLLTDEHSILERYGETLLTGIRINTEGGFHKVRMDFMDNLLSTVFPQYEPHRAGETVDSTSEYTLMYSPLTILESREYIGTMDNPDPSQKLYYHGKLEYGYSIVRNGTELILSNNL